MRAVQLETKRMDGWPLSRAAISALVLLASSVVFLGGDARVNAQDFNLPPALSTPPASLPPALPPNLPAAPGGLAAPAPLPGTNQPPAAATAPSSAPSVSYVVENGIRYEVTRSIVRQPVQDVRYEDRQQTTYQQRLRTDVQQVNYYTQVPVTEYECVPRLYDWWRVFRGGYVAYGLEPYTNFQTQPQSTNVPITSREVRPVTQVVKVPVPYLRFEDREQVTRVAMGNAGSPTSLPARPPLVPSYIPPSNVRPGISTPNFTAPSSPAPRYIPPVFGGSAVTGPSIAPYEPNPFGGWGSATGTRLNPNLGAPAIAPNFIPNTGGGLLAPPPAAPFFTPTPVPATDVGTRSSTTQYGGVARYDGGPPRYGTVSR